MGAGDERNFIIFPARNATVYLRSVERSAILHPMKSVRLLAVLLALPLASFAADRVLKLDPSASFVEVDVDVTMGDFTARLDKAHSQ